MAIEISHHHWDTLTRVQHQVSEKDYPGVLIEVAACTQSKDSLLGKVLLDLMPLTPEFIAADTGVLAPFVDWMESHCGDSLRLRIRHTLLDRMVMDHWLAGKVFECAN